MEKTKLIIFDLDDTLCDTSSTSDNAKKAMVKAMRDAGLPAKTKDIDFKGMHSLSGIDCINLLCKKYKCKKIEVTRAGTNAYYGYDRNIKLYPGTIETLKKLPQKKILLTTGIPEVQEAKVKKLRIKRYFDRIIYDNILSPQKEQTIREIKKEYGLRGKEIMAIGDKLSDIEAANHTGVISVRKISDKLRRARYANRFQVPARTIKDIRELL